MADPVVVSGAFVVGLVFGKPLVCNSGCDLPERRVRALVVVDLNELINKGLELADGLCWWPGGDPFLHCLLEPFNLAGCCRVARSGVFLFDA